ncbi:MAG TPA: molybdopterin cofactor-binding domain-containing protein, partial [Burkholderiales bacterium]|nr:molybdopterin cofactor-binding domain-containing protein [Burkholderiales bacterium]
MNSSRRRFLQSSGALVIAFNLPAAIGPASAADEKSFAPNAYIRIDAKGQVTFVVAYVEMGQGTYTSIPMLIAEELEVPLSSVRVEHAPPDERYYGNPLLGGIQATGNSNAVRGAWEPMRRAGAVAKTMLVQAAAQRWKVDAASCRAENGAVVHAASGRRLGYGALVADAAKLPVPDPKSVTLKPREQFKLIGTPAKRLDIDGKVNGTAQYGIDARLPGMKFATIAISPVIGGKLRGVDDAAAKAVNGVRQIVRLDDAVAVVGDHMGAAKKGLAALKIEWDDGANAKLSTADILRDMEAASSGSGAVARQEGDVAKALAGAAKRVEAVYGVPFFAHATMEPMNATVHVRKDSCEIWTGTQVMARVQAAAAKLTGLPVEKVTV